MNIQQVMQRVEASEGMWLRRLEDDYCTKEIFTPIGADLSAWDEITNEDKIRIDNEKRERMERELAMQENVS